MTETKEKIHHSIFYCSSKEHQIMDWKYKGCSRSCGGKEKGSGVGGVRYDGKGGEEKKEGGA